MNAQSEALRLAYLIDAPLVPFGRETAAELRRLHQFAEDQIGRAAAAEAALQMTKATHALKIAAVEAQRDALLEALKMAQFQIENQCDVGVDEWIACSKKVRAAIKAVEEGK